MKKKICFVTTIAVTLEAFFLETALYLSENGWDVTLVSSYSEDFVNKLPKNIKYKQIEMKRGISFRDILAIYHMYKFFKKENFDIVQYSTPNAGFYAAISSKLAKIKCRIYHIMGFRYLGFTGIKKQVFRVVDTIACKLSTHVECISKSNFDLGLEDNVFSSGKAYIIWNGSTGGINLNRFNYECKNKWRKEIRNQYKLDSDDFVFGFIGRITRDKGIDELIDSFSSVQNCKIIIVGNKEFYNDKELENKFSNFIKNRNVIICESKKDIERYYAAIDVLVMPSYREGFGMVVAEAAAMGVPSIVTRIPGPIDVVIDNQTAFLVEPKNVMSLKKAINYCINNKKHIKDMEKICVNHILTSYDSKILCKKILAHKNKLIGL